MKKNPFSYSRIGATFLIIAVIIFSSSCINPSFAGGKGDKPGEPTVAKSTSINQVAININDSGENQLIYQLLADWVIDEVKGFIVERKHNKLYINEQQQTDEIANKYLRSIKQEVIRVQVYPFKERLKRHPDADIQQLISPVSYSSGCVEYTQKKRGC